MSEGQYIDHNKLIEDCEKLETDYNSLHQIKASPAFTDSMFTEEQHERYNSLHFIFDIRDRINSWRINAPATTTKEKNRGLWFRKGSIRSLQDPLKLCELVACCVLDEQHIRGTFLYQLPVGRDKYLPALRRQLKEIGLLNSDSEYPHYLQKEEK